MRDTLFDARHSGDPSLVGWGAAPSLVSRETGDARAIGDALITVDRYFGREGIGHCELTASRETGSAAPARHLTEQMMATWCGCSADSSLQFPSLGRGGCAFRFLLGSVARNTQHVACGGVVVRAVSCMCSVCASSTPAHCRRVVVCTHGERRWVRQGVRPADLPCVAPRIRPSCGIRSSSRGFHLIPVVGALPPRHPSTPSAPLVSSVQLCRQSGPDEPERPRTLSPHSRSGMDRPYGAHEPGVRWVLTTLQTVGNGRDEGTHPTGRAGAARSRCTTCSTHRRSRRCRRCTTSPTHGVVDAAEGAVPLLAVHTARTTYAARRWGRRRLPTLDQRYRVCPTWRRYQQEGPVGRLRPHYLPHYCAWGLRT